MYDCFLLVMYPNVEIFVQSAIDKFKYARDDLQNKGTSMSLLRRSQS